MSKAPGRSPKGTACINCRLRKIRCDGRRPVCGSCSSTLPSACKYSDGSASPDQLLREEIAILEDRLQQLENPNEPSRTLALQSSSSSASRAPHTPFNISLNMRQALFRSFLPYSSEFGFYLNYSRFSHALSSSSSQQQPFPSILSACQLLGAYLSPVNELSALQSAFLKQALYDASLGLSRNPGELSRSLLHCVQAEILLSQYYFINGRSLEGKYRISTAVSMVLGAGFHKIRSADMYAFQGRAGMHSLPPPIDPVEEGERVNALWQVVIMNSCWTAVDGSTSHIAYDVPESRIDAPWPLDAEAYSQIPLENVQGRHTIQNFVSNTPDNRRSLLALHAKAAILFERASLLRRQYQPNMSLSEATRFQQAFTNLNNVINNMATVLPSLSDPSHSRSKIRRLVVVHTLCRVATIILHGTFIQQDPSSHSQVLSAAESVAVLFRSVNLSDFPFVDPIMGHLWMTTAHVFIQEIGSQGTSRLPRRVSLKELMDSTEVIMSTMKMFAPRSSLIESQLTHVRQSYMAVMR